MEDKRIYNVIVGKPGGRATEGSLDYKVFIPKGFAEQLGISKDDKSVYITYDNNKIIIEKAPKIFQSNVKKLSKQQLTDFLTENKGIDLAKTIDIGAYIQDEEVKTYITTKVDAHITNQNISKGISLLEIFLSWLRKDIRKREAVNQMNICINNLIQEYENK